MNCFSWHIPQWSRYLNKFKDKPYLKFMEIGSIDCISSVWLLDNILTDKSSRLVKILPHNINVPMQYYNQITIKQGSSRNVLIESAYMKEDYDFVYIDGDHSAQSVLQDAVLAFPLLKPQSIMIFNDYLWKINNKEPNEVNLRIPKNAIDIFLTIYADKISILCVDDQVIIEKL